jgi:hypothetical protein
MVDITIKKWWKACGIPLAETDWRNIRLYSSENEDVWKWTQCIYFIRLAPPFQIAYGPNDESNSPLIYIGKGAIKQRWAEHTKWISDLGHWLPGARYEVWLFQHPLCAEIESDALWLFRQAFGRLPLANRRRENSRKKHEYDKNLHQVSEHDRRYWWALRPTQKDVKEYFDRGIVPADEFES